MVDLSKVRAEVKRLLETPEGQEELKATLDRAKKACDELNEARKVSWQQLYEPFTI